jgi:cell division protein FtsL
MLAYKPAQQYSTRPERRPEPNRRVTQQPAPQIQRDPASKEKLAWMGTILLCIAIAVILISRYALIAEQNYELLAMRQQAASLQAGNSMLRDQVNQLSSPDRIIQIAKQLGMKEVVPQPLSTDPAGWKSK